MNLRSLEIFGFKSFGEKVRLDFLGGINAIIGPNGSGKSNVVEAIRWASHTARTRELRARNATELIFHGSAGKQAVSMAEVKVELAGLGDLSRVQIERRLFRDGEGELELSGKTVRVRDLHDALRGSGLGPGGVAVVGQGEIGAVIGANPETMLGYLEEAAGLSRATFRRNQTIERLEVARNHLARLEDVASEVRLRVEKLEVAAKNALEHASLSSEQHILEAAVTRSRLRQLRQEIAELESEIATLETQSQTFVESIAQSSQALVAGRGARETKQSEFVQVSAESERLAGELRLMRERISATDARLVQAQQERQQLLHEQQSLQEIAEPVAPTKPNQTPDPQPLQLAQQELNRAIALEATWRNDLEAARSKRETLERQSAETRAKAAAAGAEHETLKRELQETQAAILELQAASETNAPALGEAQDNRDAARRLLDRLEREASGVADRIAESGARLSELRAQTGALGREVARLEASRDNRAYFAEGPRKALRSGIDGILGPVSDLIRVPANLETAFAAALGRRLENIVVQRAEVAEAVITHLKNVGGRATFLALDMFRPRERRRIAWLQDQGVLGVAADLIESDAPSVLEGLLGDTVIVETLAIATRIARANPQRPRLVTLDGELFESTGAITGGRGRETSAEPFAESRRLREATQELETLKKEQDTLDTQLGEDRENATRSREAIVRADARLQETLNALETQRAKHNQTQTQLETFHDRAKQLEARIALLPKPGPNEDQAELPNLAPFETGLEDATARLTHARNQERTLDTALRETEAAWRVFGESQRAHEAAMAQHQQAQQRLALIATRLGHLQQEIDEGQNKLDAASPEIQILEAARAALGLDALRHEIAALDATRATLERQQSETSQQLSQTREILEQRKLAKARRETNLETTLQNATDEQLALADPEGTPRSWTIRVNEIRARLLEIGLVNPLAAEEYAQEQQRLQDMEQGVNDARAAAGELEEALELLERDVTAKLRDAIQRVGTKFREYITELLGGEGTLEVVRDEAGAMQGLAMQVTPKGKRTRAMHLLSAGERTMAALAFIFSLSVAPEDSSGLPFAALDEVDAPLDEANIRRFTSFLQMLAKQGTQFVLVTHQKATMEVAEALWGVTTDSGGVSRVYSIKQTQASAAD